MQTASYRQHLETSILDTEDGALMERIQSGDEKALESLVKRYAKLLRSVVGRMISNEQDVSDVIEEVTLGVWNQAANFDLTKGKVMGWIITMARRRAIDRVRRRQAYNRAEMRFRLSNDTGTGHFSGDDVEKEAARSDTASMFGDLLSTLPAAQCKVVRMAFYRGLSHREIARETGIPLGTVETRPGTGSEETPRRRIGHRVSRGVAHWDCVKKLDIAIHPDEIAIHKSQQQRESEEAQECGSNPARFVGAIWEGRGNPYGRGDVFGIRDSIFNLNGKNVLRLL